MLRSLFRQTVDAWLENNSARFDRKPYVVRRSRHLIVLGFTGLPQNLRIHLSSWGGCEIAVWQDDKIWDFLGDLDLSERRTADGFYFCGNRLERTLYASRKALWTTHSLEALLRWANRELRVGRALYLSESSGGGSTWASIHPAPGTAGAEKGEGADFVYPFE